AAPLPMAAWLEPGTHVTSVGGRPDDETAARIDVLLRFGSAPGPAGLPAWEVPDEHVAHLAPPTRPPWTPHRLGPDEGRVVRWSERAARTVSLQELLSGQAPGRTTDAEITYSERGNLQGAQFWAVAGRVYEAARAQGLGRELPTEWFLQDIRD